MSKNNNTIPLLRLTRRTIELLPGPLTVNLVTCEFCLHSFSICGLERILPYRALIEQSEDHELIHIVKQCTETELIKLGYFGIALNRYQFITWWWGRPALPQLDAHGFVHAILALQLYRLRFVKGNPVKLLLAIIRSKALCKLYPTILCWEADHNMPMPENGFNYESVKDLEPELQLRLLLVELASSIPNGVYILWSEWKNYQYPVDIV